MSSYERQRRRRQAYTAAGWTAFLAAMLALTVAIWTADGWLLGQQLTAQAGVLVIVAVVAAIAAEGAR